MPDRPPPTERPADPDGPPHLGNAGTLIKAFCIAGLILIVLVLLVYGAGVFIPLAVALLLWFFINALAKAFQRLWSRRLGPLRGLALLLALLTLLAASLFIADVVVTNLSAIGASSTDFERSLDPLIDEVAAVTGIPHEDVINKLLDQLGMEKLLGAIVGAMTGLASQLGVVFIYVIFLLVEQQLFDAKLNAVVRDAARRQQIRSILDRVGRDIQSYLWVMTLVSLLTAALSYGVMIAVGLNQPLFWAFLIFVLNFIPTIGSIIATALPSLYALLQFGNFTPFLILLVLIGAIQFVIGNVIQPRLAAKTLNVSQFVVILALFVWGAIWGVVGMFLAVPITSIIMIVCSNFPATRPIAAALSQSGEFFSDQDAEDAESAGSPQATTSIS